MKHLFIIYVWILCSCSAPREVSIYYRARSLEDGSVLLIQDKRPAGSGDLYRIADTIELTSNGGWMKIETCPKFVILGKM